MSLYIFSYIGLWL